MHLAMLDSTKKYLEARTNTIVIGGFLSPGPDCRVTTKLQGTNPKLMQYMKIQQRLHLINLAISNSPWLAVSPWEALDNKDPIHFTRVLEHHSVLFKSVLPAIKCAFLCGSDLGYPLLQQHALCPSLPCPFPVMIFHRHSKTSRNAVLQEPLKKANFTVISDPFAADISSTEIRAALLQGASVQQIEYFCAPAVAKELVGQRLSD
eukprot:TRINITY_DN22220_c0_g1_i1.p1 TRINITY_DN22220_c0_g1~~TRINITY_DN22220_c0_g1_i1.p1  ORF type:complete len:205 (-),score=22.07 TRINITY_DN22220_c0_g1_i1:69-683(-)